MTSTHSQAEDRAAPQAAAPVAAVIGDVIDSRGAPDRQELHALLVRGLAATDAALPGIQPLVITAGDEFQGVYADVGAAVVATLRIRLALAPTVDVRFGLGWGTVTVLDPARTPVVQDGPGWWSARAAIEETARLQQRASGRAVRARFRCAPGAGGAPPQEWVNALLGARDLCLARLPERSLRLLEGGLSDRTQILMAQQEGVSQSAVSQAFTRDGLGMLVDLHRSLLPTSSQPSPSSSEVP